MAKVLIETTGDFELLDFGQNGLVVQADRPTVSADNSQFISSRATLGQVKTIATLSDEATDEEFEKFWKESKSEVEVKDDASDEEKAKAEADAKKKQKELAVAAFTDAYAVREESETAKAEEKPSEQPQNSGRRNNKPQAE